MKKKYSVYRSKAIYGFSDPRRLFFVFINEDDELSEYEKSLIYPIECVYNTRFVCDSWYSEPPSPSFMEKLEYCGEVDSIYDIDFDA